MRVNEPVVRVLASMCVLFCVHAAVAASAPLGQDEAVPGHFVIGPGAGDTHSHAAFPGTPHDLVKVSAHVRVTEAIDKGLNFFAIQVNFPNKTWAHGGLQLVRGKYQMNWGGLVNRGGGSTDYRVENPVSDLQLMQNGPNSERSAPYAWKAGKEYVLTIERGRQVTLPPGEYVFIGNGPKVAVAEARTMWEWRFTLKPADGEGPVQVSTLYDAADRIGSFYIWNECGYGSCGNGQSATWSMPEYARSGAAGGNVRAQALKRF